MSQAFAAVAAPATKVQSSRGLDAAWVAAHKQQHFSDWDEPPEGWCRVFSKSTNKVYFSRLEDGYSTFKCEEVYGQLPKSLTEWESQQDKFFPNWPPLPYGWFRIRKPDEGGRAYFVEKGTYFTTCNGWDVVKRTGGSPSTAAPPAPQPSAAVQSSGGATLEPQPSAVPANTGSAAPAPQSSDTEHPKDAAKTNRDGDAIPAGEPGIGKKEKKLEPAEQSEVAAVAAIAGEVVEVIDGGKEEPVVVGDESQQEQLGKDPPICIDITMQDNKVEEEVRHGEDGKSCHDQRRWWPDDDKQDWVEQSGHESGADGTDWQKQDSNWSRNEGDDANDWRDEGSGDPRQEEDAKSRTDQGATATALGSGGSDDEAVDGVGADGEEETENPLFEEFAEECLEDECGQAVGDVDATDHQSDDEETFAPLEAEEANDQPDPAEATPGRDAWTGKRPVLVVRNPKSKPAVPRDPSPPQVRSLAMTAKAGPAPPPARSRPQVAVNVMDLPPSIRDARPKSPPRPPAKAKGPKRSAAARPKSPMRPATARPKSPMRPPAVRPSSPIGPAAGRTTSPIGMTKSPLRRIARAKSPPRGRTPLRPAPPTTAPPTSAPPGPRSSRQHGGTGSATPRQTLQPRGSISTIESRPNPGGGVPRAPGIFRPSHRSLTVAVQTATRPATRSRSPISRPSSAPLPRPVPRRDVPAFRPVWRQHAAGSHQSSQRAAPPTAAIIGARANRASVPLASRRSRSPRRHESQAPSVDGNSWRGRR